MIKKILRLDYPVGMDGPVGKIEDDIFKKDSFLTLYDAEKGIDNMPKIFFLVGNNGAGKTTILRSIHNLQEHTVPLRAIVLNFTYLTEENKVKILNLNQHDKNASFSVGHISYSYDNTKNPLLTISSINDTDSRKAENLELDTALSQIEGMEYLTGNTKENIIRQIEESRKSSKEDRDKKSLLSKEIYIKALNYFYNGSKKYIGIRRGNLWFIDTDNKEIDSNTFSSGENLILSRITQLVYDFHENHSKIILIDEPETSLHPKWQKKYVQFLLEVFKDEDVQIIIATHSPYILQGMKEGESIAIKIDRYKGGEIGEQIGDYPDSLKNPSINLINYLAYGIVDELLHIELWTALAIKLVEKDEKKDGYKEVCDYLDGEGVEVAGKDLYKKGKNKN